MRRSLRRRLLVRSHGQGCADRRRNDRQKSNMFDSSHPCRDGCSDGCTYVYTGRSLRRRGCGDRRVDRSAQRSPRVNVCATSEPPSRHGLLESNMFDFWRSLRRRSAQPCPCERTSNDRRNYANPNVARKVTNLILTYPLCINLLPSCQLHVILSTRHGITCCHA